MPNQLARNALAALQRGSFAEAEAICADVLRRDPHNAHALQVLGNVRAFSGDMVAAESLFEQARAAAPKDPVILNSLGGAYGANGKLSEARAVLEEALAVDGRFFWAHQNLGNVLADLGERALARKHYEAAVAASPNYAEAIAGLADLAEKEHRLDEAEQLALRALKTSPQLAPATIVLARLALRRGDYQNVLARLGALAESRTIRAGNRAIVLNLLGQAHEALGDYDKAFASFTAANETQRSVHGAHYAGTEGVMSLEAISRLTTFVETADPASWTNAPDDGRDPVFFVGFPRSGTTLLDQVLASHHDIQTGEELEGLEDAVRPLVLNAGALERWATLSADEIAKFRNGYWRRSESALGAPPSRPIFIDKMPLYTVLLPLIYRLFPRAKILFAVRDPRDVAISCFEQDFAMNAAMFHFTSLEGTVGYYDAVMRLAEVSQRKLPLRVHTVRYEDLVGDFDRTVGGTLDFLGLPWDGAVRDYAETARRRVLKTPSALQVIRPLYSSSIGRWRRFEKQLAPHMPILNRWALAFDYPSG